MPDTKIFDVPLSGMNPDLQLALNSGKLTHYHGNAWFDKPENPDLFPS
jgi:hypothetical protein